MNSEPVCPNQPTSYSASFVGFWIFFYRPLICFSPNDPFRCGDIESRVWRRPGFWAPFDKESRVSEAGAVELSIIDAFQSMVI